jgi:hypothetical protein
MGAIHSCFRGPYYTNWPGAFDYMNGIMGCMAWAYYGRRYLGAVSDVVLRWQSILL